MVLCSLIMTLYDLTLVVQPEFPATDTKKVKDLVDKFLGETGAAVGDVTSQGKKPLAYPIRKAKEGIFVTATISGNRFAVSDLEKRAKAGSDILRFLVTVKGG